MKRARSGYSIEQNLLAFCGCEEDPDDKENHLVPRRHKRIFDDKSRRNHLRPRPQVPDPYSGRGTSQYYVSQIVRNLQGETEQFKHLSTVWTHLRLLRSTPLPAAEDLAGLLVRLPVLSGPRRKTLVLDLDETLVHCNQSLDMPCDAKIEVQFPDGSRSWLGLNIRPFAAEFIRSMARFFEVVVFTASQACYAQQVLALIDPDRIIQTCICRQNCFLSRQGFFVKDLRVLEGRDLQDVILVDNAGYSFAYQIDNAVPILNYYSGGDWQLRGLQKYLQGLVFRDVRNTNRQTFRLGELAEEEDLRAGIAKHYKGWIFQ